MAGKTGRKLFGSRHTGRRWVDSRGRQTYRQAKRAGLTAVKVEDKLEAKQEGGR